ncbi:hypothetical protein [Nostoc sp.]|uniref:hypothetical protein n=1 Tax=Nostoc sp. TaxID=1180 RepID=UPI002FEEE184
MSKKSDNNKLDLQTTILLVEAIKIRVWEKSGFWMVASGESIFPMAIAVGDKRCNPYSSILLFSNRLENELSSPLYETQLLTGFPNSV